jgi:hypothetical protein
LQHHFFQMKILIKFNYNSERPYWFTLTQSDYIHYNLIIIVWNHFDIQTKYFVLPIPYDFLPIATSIFCFHFLEYHIISHYITLYHIISYYSSYYISQYIFPQFIFFWYTVIKMKLLWFENSHIFFQPGLKATHKDHTLYLLSTGFWVQ